MNPNRLCPYGLQLCVRDNERDGGPCINEDEVDCYRSDSTTLATISIDWRCRLSGNLNPVVSSTNFFSSSIFFSWLLFAVLFFQPNS